MKENENLSIVKEFLEAENADMAQNIFQKIEPDNSEAYFMVKGLLEQTFQKWGAAINSFQKVLVLNPDNKEAQNHIQMIRAILNFWNPESFNP